MKKTGIFILLYAFLISTYAQKYNPLLPPNTYQNADNPNYWKNKMPHPGYWQQDVHYRIKADIDEKTDIITASEKLTYWNNSPDTLTFVYFHLYQNAFQPGSYYDELHKVNKRKTVYGKYESQGKGTEILKLLVEGKEVQTELDNTILKVYLPRPLLPGESIEFDIDFKTYFDTGNVRRRMKVYTSWGYKHYNGVHWYPRISVYDRKFGWTTDQHLGKEFYGDFGTFDVELTFANNFIVEATGYMLNRDEMLPEELRAKLDIKNFADKPWNSPPSEIIPYDSLKRKTWKFHAENVHDFAFTADPTYRIGEAEWDGIKCYALVQEPHAAKWQNAAEYTAKIIQTFSEDFGRYTYHKMIVADARDGMEYPMLTLDGGWDPDYRGLFVHEIGHNWFFGQVGNNETYRAALDEGFTQFLTAWGLQKLEGDTIPRTPSPSKYKERFRKPYLNRVHNVYYGYISDAIREEDPPLNTRSDDFKNALGHGGGYRHVYYKTATMLYNLQYVLGDELFQKAMKHYFAQWKIAHPYFEDFRNSVIRYTHVDLNWFFDQWLETTKYIDYSVKRVKKLKEKDSYAITFERKGTMEMPLDFTATNYNNQKYHFHIPNNWYVKKTDATVLPKWTGWGILNKKYTARIDVPGGLKTVEIDTTKRLADVNYLNNSNYIPLSYQFDSRIYNRPDLYNYELFARPELWYNALDGLKAGIHFNGNYMRYKHVFTLTLWMNSG
ncbi:MAG: M1 family peptidase, partial [Bacteroidetes bacterium]